MNCKEGDLAIVVRSICGNEGRIFTCIKLHDNQTHDVDGLPFDPRDPVVPRWVIDRPMNSIRGNGVLFVDDVCAIDDKNIRPLREDPGADETLSWKDVPQEVKA